MHWKHKRISNDEPNLQTLKQYWTVLIAAHYKESVQVQSLIANIAEVGNGI